MNEDLVDILTEADEDLELQVGTEIESEHKDLVEKIKADILKNGKLTLTDEEIYEIIAKAHLEEDPDYYDKLLKYIEGRNDGKLSYVNVDEYLPDDEEMVLPDEDEDFEVGEDYEDWPDEELADDDLQDEGYIDDEENFDDITDEQEDEDFQDELDRAEQNEEEIESVVTEEVCPEEEQQCTEEVKKIDAVAPLVALDYEAVADELKRAISGIPGVTALGNIKYRCYEEREFIVLYETPDELLDVVKYGGDEKVASMPKARAFFEAKAILATVLARMKTKYCGKGYSFYMAGESVKSGMGGI